MPIFELQKYAIYNLISSFLFSLTIYSVPKLTFFVCCITPLLFICNSIIVQGKIETKSLRFVELKITTWGDPALNKFRSSAITHQIAWIQITSCFEINSLQVLFKFKTLFYRLQFIKKMEERGACAQCKIRAYFPHIIKCTYYSRIGGQIGGLDW